MEAGTSQEPVSIIGAGIVGVCCALSLQESGYRVELIDHSAPGEATSHGNAGVISPWSCVPQCLPGTLKKIPRWLLDRSGPVSVRWRYLHRSVPWTIRFLQNTRPEQVNHIADTMDWLMRDNVATYKHHLHGTGHENLLIDSWYVNVFRGALRPNLDDLPWRLRMERGAPVEVVDAATLADIEPALSRDCHSAVIIRDQARAFAPGKLCKVLAEKAMALGCEFVQSELKRIEPVAPSGTQATYALHLGDNILHRQKVVLATGIWSAALLEPLGFKLPLIAERGYHTEFIDPGVSLRHSVMDVQGKFVVSQMIDGLRAAGTSEFAPIDAAPDYRRAELLKPLVRQLLPGVDTDNTRYWMGTRPSFPDNLPAIGEIGRFKGLFCAFGHSHYGMGMAPATGRLVAESLSGVAANQSRAAVAVERFFT